MDHFIEHYFYKIRILLVIPLLYIFRELLISTPTREIVHSDIYLYTMLFLAFYSTLFIYMYLHSLLALILMLILAPFVLLSRERYNGGIDNSNETFFYIMLSLVLVQILIWFVSLFFKARPIGDDARDEKKYPNNLKVIATIKSLHQETTDVIINEMTDCIYSAELEGCNGSINFTEQYLEHLETRKETTQSYLVVCSYFKFSDYHQEKETYSITIASF